MKNGKKKVPYVRSPFNSFPGSVKSPMLTAGLLTRSGDPAFPSRDIAEQWQKSGQPDMELTAAGTVPGFHGIPY